MRVTDELAELVLFPLREVWVRQNGGKHGGRGMGAGMRRVQDIRPWVAPVRLNESIGRAADRDGSSATLDLAVAPKHLAVGRANNNWR